MSLTINPDDFRFPESFRAGVAGKRVLITGAGKDRGLGQAFALGAALNGAECVGVHFHHSYEDGLATVDLINANGGKAFPVQADVTNPGEVWAMRSHVMRRMGGRPPNVVICNSGLSESGYILGRPPTVIPGESTATRRARARKLFVDSLEQSRAVMDTKLDGFLTMTHLWAGEAVNDGEPLQIVYISSRQAFEPGAGVPGYVAANWGVLSYPNILAVNLGKLASLVSACSVALPFVRTGMTQAYAENPKVFGRWQPRMLEPHEASQALLQLLAQPREATNRRTYQMNVAAAEDDVRVTWSEIQIQTTPAAAPWSDEQPLLLHKESTNGAQVPAGRPIRGAIAPL